MRTKVAIMTASLVIFTITLTAGAGENPQSGETEIILREMPSQTVLYRVVRGNYQVAGQSVGELFALAGQKGIMPTGSPSYTYLNNPRFVSQEHWLTEIRIPISANSMKLAGTLGEMTDVKEIPAMTVAVAVKPEGVAEPDEIYKRLHTWLRKNDYFMVESPSETILTNAMSGDYPRMKSEIIIPVEKLKAEDGD